MLHFALIKLWDWCGILIMLPARDFFALLDCWHINSLHSLLTDNIITLERTNGKVSYRRKQKVHRTINSSRRLLKIFWRDFLCKLTWSLLATSANLRTIGLLFLSQKHYRILTTSLWFMGAHCTFSLTRLTAFLSIGTIVYTS